MNAGRLNPVRSIYEVVIPVHIDGEPEGKFVRIVAGSILTPIGTVGSESLFSALKLSGVDVRAFSRDRVRVLAINADVLPCIQSWIDTMQSDGAGFAGMSLADYMKKVLVDNG